MSRNSKGRRPGWWYPYIFFAAFGVVIAVNIALFYFATSTFTGLETEGAYEKGLAYNRTLAAAEAQAARGWTAVAEIGPAEAAAPAGQRTATVAVTFRDRSGVAIDGLAVRAMLTRPTTAGHDLEARLEGRGEGRYVAVVGLPMPGQWDLNVIASGADGEFQLNERVFLP